MNILLLTPQLPYPPRQGTTIRNYNLIRGLAERHTVDLLTFWAPGETLTDDSPLHTLCRTVMAVPQPERTLSRRGRDTFTRRLPDMGLRLENDKMRALTRKLVDANDYDIIQTEGIEMAQYGALAREIASAAGPKRPAWVFDDHNCEYLLQKRSALTDLRNPPRWAASAYSLVQWRKLESYERQICRQVDAVVAVSPADAEALQSLVPGLDVTVVSNGIDLGLYPLVAAGPAGERPALVFTGKMDYRPNIDAVLWFCQNVLPRIQAGRPDVRFQIVGMNPHPRLDELRANPAIVITGMVPETISYIQKAAVYVIPMRVGGGTRFKVLEAMSSGKPVVTTSLGVEGIPVRHGQELLIADTPDAFADAVLHLLVDDKATLAKKRQMGKSARAFVEARYGWSQITPKLEALYRRLVQSQD